MAENEAVASVTTVLTMEAQGYSAQMKRVLAENSRLRRSLTQNGIAIDDIAKRGQRAGNLIAMAGHKTVQPWMASSAALRVMEGNITNNIRAGERFLATFKPVQGLLMKAFPVIGAVALVGVIGQAIERIDKFYKRIDAVPDAINQAFGSMNRSLQTSNDELQKRIDVTKQKIAELQGRRTNHLAIELDDARIAADKLADSLHRDQQRINEILKTNKISFFDQVASGKGSTADVTGSIGSYEQKLAKLGDQQRIALGHGDSKGAAAIGQQISATERSASQYAENEIKKRTGDYTYLPNGTMAFAPRGKGAASYATQFGNQDANLAILRGFDAQVLGRLDQGSLTQKSQQVQKVYDGMQRTNALGSRAQQDPLQREIAHISQQTARLNAQTAATMAKMVSDFHVYATGSVSAKASYRGAVQQNPELHRSGVDTVNWFKSVNDSRSIRTANTTNFQQTALSIQRKTGAVTNNQYLRRVAAAHTQAYQQQTAQIHAAMAQTAADPSLTVIQRRGRMQQLQNQLDQVNGAYQSMSAVDTANITASTAKGAATQAVAANLNSMTDPGRFAGGMASSLLAGSNAGFAQMMIGNRGGWSSLFYGASSQAGMFGLGNVEKGLVSGLGKLPGHLGAAGSAIGKLFGHGGKIGTKSNPMYVIDANSTAQKAAGLSKTLAGLKIPKGASSMMTSVSSISSLLTGGGTSGVGGAMGALAGVAKLAGMFAGGFASGGTIPTGKLALVGEKGPELMYSGSGPHTVIPNHAIGGGGTTVMNIDARGTDPALAASHLQAALSVVHQKSVSQALALHHDNARRRPKG